MNESFIHYIDTENIRLKVLLSSRIKHSILGKRPCQKSQTGNIMGTSSI